MTYKHSIKKSQRDRLGKIKGEREKKRRRMLK
jgi:hypothetical protein